LGRKINAQLGRIASRDRELIFEIGSLKIESVAAAQAQALAQAKPIFQPAVPVRRASSLWRSSGSALSALRRIMGVRKRTHDGICQDQKRKPAIGSKGICSRPSLETARHRATQFVPEGRPLIP
jgi:hypothetical protein